PFEWVRPSRFGIERVYSKGPLARLRVLAQLTPKPGGGTHLTYETWSTPRNLPGAVAIPLQLSLVVARRFRAAILKYDQAAFQGTESQASVPPNRSLSSFDLARLRSLQQKLHA